MINAKRKEFNVTRMSKDQNVPFSWGFLSRLYRSVSSRLINPVSYPACKLVNVIDNQWLF